MQTTAFEVQPVRPVYLKDPLSKDHGRHKLTFKEVLKRKMKEDSHLKPHKARVEFTGILNASRYSSQGHMTCHFQLSTEDTDLLLRAEGNLVPIAKEYLWEEVVVRGSFDETGSVLNIERIFPTQAKEDFFSFLRESDWEIERIRNKIDQEGCLNGFPLLAS